jgi:hypothetical protein
VVPTTSQPSSPASAASGSAGIAATYSLVPGEDYGSTFHAQVVLTNHSGHAASWVLTIRYPMTVTPTHAWINNSVQPVVFVNGHTATFSGGAKLAAGASITLFIEATKAAGPFGPLTCTVNGATCGRA